MYRNDFLAASFALLAACGPSTPAQAPEGAKETPSAEPVASPSSTPSAEPAAEAKKAEPPASPMETLARELVKSGGRRIGWSASKKRFIVPIEMRADGGRGLDLRFYDDEGAQREILRVCQPGECEEQLNEIAKALLPKVTARLESEGYVAINGIGWPSGREEIDVGTLGGKLRHVKASLQLLRDGKPAANLRAAGKALKDVPIKAVYPAPDTKLLGAFVGEDGALQEFFVFKLP